MGVVHNVPTEVVSMLVMNMNGEETTHTKSQIPDSARVVPENPRTCRTCNGWQMA